jgi:hypothetical protein
MRFMKRVETWLVLAALLGCKQLASDGTEDSRCESDGDCRNGLGCQDERCTRIAAAPTARSTAPRATEAPAVPTEPTPAPAPVVTLGSRFDGPPEGVAIQRLVPLNRTFPSDLLIWGPSGWNTFDTERLDDYVHVHAPDDSAVVFVNSRVHKANDTTRKLWTESLTVRGASYGPWEPGALGAAHWPAKVSQGTGTLDGQPVDLFAIGATYPASEILVIACIKQQATEQTRATVDAIVKSLRRG